MTEVRYVSSEEFNAIVERNNEAIALRKKAKNKNLTLAAKLELLSKAKALEAQNAH